MAFNPLDPYGIGVSLGFGGVDATAPADYTPSYKLISDPATRRKTLSQIIGWLETHRGTAEKPAHTFDDILAATKLEHIDQTARNELYKDIKANPKVLAPDADHIQYRATHPGLFNIQDLAQYLAKFTYGLPADELADAYAGVKEDIDTLVATKALYSIAYIEKKKTILFPVQPEYAMHVDQDLKEMWHAIQMPKSVVELEEKLHAHGHLSETQYRAGHLQKSRLMQAQIKLASTQKILSAAERRAKRRRYPQKLTNTHLLGQYEWSVRAGMRSLLLRMHSGAHVSAAEFLSFGVLASLSHPRFNAPGKGPGGPGAASAAPASK